MRSVLPRRPYEHAYHRLPTSPAAHRALHATSRLQEGRNTTVTGSEDHAKPQDVAAHQGQSASPAGKHAGDDRKKVSTGDASKEGSKVPGEPRERGAATANAPSSSGVTKSEGSSSSADSSFDNLAHDWEANPDLNISNFSELPYSNFGVNQHITINAAFKEALRQIPWQFRAPIRYAFAYGSGVFPQSKPDGRDATPEEISRVHPKPPPAVQKAQNGTPKMIDFIFGVTFTQHWHSLNLNQHRDHYSALGSLGSGAVSYVQDRMGAGVYYNTHVVVNGTLIKYGVVNIDTLCRDLTEWDTLYLAGRLHKPVKILRDDARVRLANQMNLLSALRTALLLLPERFTEMELYQTLAGISYLGDPRMTLPTENPQKISNIVGHNIANFQRLYNPLIENLPNLSFDSSSDDPNRKLRQDMDPVRRGNMVRRLPKSFRSKLYFQYQRKFEIPQVEFDAMMGADRDADASSKFKRAGAGGGKGGFERRIAQDDPAELRGHVRKVIKRTIGWPSTTQSLKGVLTGGLKKSAGYVWEKVEKYREGAKKAATAVKDEGKKVSEEVKKDDAKSDKEKRD